MALTTKFEKELQKLFNRRTSWLRQAIGKNRPGRPHIFNRRKVAPKLYELGELAAEILVRRRGRKEIRRVVEGKRQWHVNRGKGHGIDAKRTQFPQWSGQKRPTVVRSKPANGCGPEHGSFIPSSLDQASPFSFSSFLVRISGCDRGVAAGRAWR